jgi:hypothetical protein
MGWADLHGFIHETRDSSRAPCGRFIHKHALLLLLYRGRFRARGLRCRRVGIGRIGLDFRTPCIAG